MLLRVHCASAAGSTRAMRAKHRWRSTGNAEGGLPSRSLACPLQGTVPRAGQSTPGGGIPAAQPRMHGVLGGAQRRRRCNTGGPTSQTAAEPPPPHEASPWVAAQVACKHSMHTPSSAQIAVLHTHRALPGPVQLPLRLDKGREQQLRMAAGLEHALQEGVALTGSSHRDGPHRRHGHHLTQG